MKIHFNEGGWRHKWLPVVIINSVGFKYYLAWGLPWRHWKRTYKFKADQPKDNNDD